MATQPSRATEELFRELGELSFKLERERGEGEVIQVSDLTRGLGFLYEKIRNVLDYHEEHLWAKNAIERILKRRVHEILAGRKIGRPLVEELIRGHYLENSAVPESRCADVDNILEKYREVLTQIEEKKIVEERELRDLETWFLKLAASELEETVNRSHGDQAYINFLYQAIKQHLKVAPGVDYPYLDLQIYLASYGAFLQADEFMESYTLFRLYFPEWQNPFPDLFAEIGQDLPEIRDRIRKTLSSPIRKELDRILKRRSVLVFLLRDIIGQEPDSALQVLASPDALEQSLRHFYEMRYRGNRAKLQRSAARAVVFIFLTKTLLALVAEIPYELWRTGDVNFITLGINTFLPPLILIGVAIAIRMPGEEQNFLKLVTDFEKIVSQSPSPEPLDILRPPKRRSAFLKISLGFLYLVNFAITLGILFWLFKAFHFSWPSAALFVFFLSLVSFFALRLRKTANELAAIEEREHILRSTLEFIIFPVVEIGRLLAKGLASINIIALVFDFFIEAPFKAFVEILEEWFSFMRERKQAL